jgi:hypothetical protein
MSVTTIFRQTVPRFPGVGTIAYVAVANLVHWRSAPSFYVLSFATFGLPSDVVRGSGFGYISATARAHTDSVSLKVVF